MRILLVKPRPQLAPIRALQRFQLLEPLELGYVAAAVPPGHEVRILDLRLARFPGWAFRRALARFRPELVGFTAYSHESADAKRLAREARAALPHAKRVVGGHHATVAPEDFLHDDPPLFDAVVRGEGSAPFRTIVERAAAGAPFDGIPQVAVPGATESPGWPLYPDPAQLPRVRRDLWDPRRYHAVWVREDAPDWASIDPPVAMVRASWGCRMKCTFCIVPSLCGGRHLPRPPDDVADEIAALEAGHVYFCDDENFIDPGFALELAEALARRGVKKRYFAWARSTTVLKHPEVFRTWRALGLDAAFIGFEFPTDEQLKRVAKGATVADNARAHEALRADGVAVHAGFMLMPESGEEEFQRLAEYVRAMPPAQLSFTVCTPSPGTPDYEAIRDRIWVDNPYELHDCMHPLTPTALPLRRFCALFARQVAEGGHKTPLRTHNHPVPPLELARILTAAALYPRAFATIYRDYPRELWG
ncbi:MAG: B12-binding domain-containing radical SAM protein [Acidobacteria bacterium]|jgi:radical SAM superfamily enzyme YgiQ (UPF0313 family)|nr:B12-binding domain-containing radical SAM protein [Acidobacteriota bacterium]MCU0254209.1 B12-binding domain-containing radical SAM protein [Acidobacteriota bacterium]